MQVGEGCGGGKVARKGEAFLQTSGRKRRKCQYTRDSFGCVGERVKEGAEMGLIGVVVQTKSWTSQQ